MLCRKIILAFYGLMPACFILAQNPSPKTTAIADKIVAVVGDHIILSSDIQNSINDLARQDGPIPANAACLVTEQAIISKLLMLQALKDSLPVTDEDVEAELDRRIGHYIKQPGSEKDDKAIYRIRDEARGQLKEIMLAEAMQQKIAGNIKISPAEVKSFFDRIPKDSLPFLEAEIEAGQIIFYPAPSVDLEQYVINELNNYKKQVESKTMLFCPLEKVTDNKDGCSEQEINRNNKDLDPAFISAAFRLKNGEISAPVKCRFGFYLIQMVERKMDDAVVRYIFRPHSVTDIEINQAKLELNKLRSEITDGRIGFNEAALKYSDDSRARFPGPFFLNQEGASSVTIDQLEREVADIINKMNVGEISRPMLFIDDQNKKGIRIIFLKSRSERHIMNLRTDYSKIARIALEEKKARELEKWLKTKIPSYYIMVDNSTAADCPMVQKYASVDSK